MRAFIAFDLPKKIKSAIAKIQDDLKRAGVNGKWVKPTNIHLTAAFLGTIDNKQSEEIKKILGSINQKIKEPISLQLKQISAFPSVNHPRVVFVNLSGEINHLNQTVKELRGELKNKKIWFDEKPFIPHLTLARLKTKQDISLIIKKALVEKISFKIKEASLFQSQLTPSGSIYQQL